MSKTGQTEAMNLRLRSLRPLLWWSLLVLALGGYQIHRVLSERTRVHFSIQFDDGSNSFGAIAAVDGREILNGDRVSVGWHTVRISHPNANDFSTNIFIWYGPHEIGTVVLRRLRGTLIVQADPPARLLKAYGPGFEKQEFNSYGFTSSVPTGQFKVDARYENWSKTEEVVVGRSRESVVRIMPQFGAINLESTHDRTIYRLKGNTSSITKSGELPVKIPNLPIGEYRVWVQRSGREQEATLVVSTNETTLRRFEFNFGALHVESEPPGASVLDQNGRRLGETPLSLADLDPGVVQLTLKRNGFEPLREDVEVIANVTTTIRKKLQSSAYAQAITAARRHLAAGNAPLALQATKEALKNNPDDDEAKAIERKANRLAAISDAKLLAKDGNFIGGISRLNALLETWPDDREAISLIEDFRSGQREALKVEEIRWRERGGKLFEELLSEQDGSEFFEAHKLTSAKSIAALERSVLTALNDNVPKFTVRRNYSPVSATFAIIAYHDWPLLSTKSGRCEVVIVGAMMEGQTELYFKVLDYKPEFKRPDGAPISTPAVQSLVPIHPRRLGVVPPRLQRQVQESQTDMKARMERAVQ